MAAALAAAAPAPAEGAAASADPAAPQRVTVHLRVRDASGLSRRAAAVSDPRSSRYGRRLSWREYRRRFAPERATVAAVRQWAALAGLRVAFVPRNRLFVVLTAPAALPRVLGEPALPPALAPHVLAITRGDSEPQLEPAVTPAPDLPFVPGPCSQFWGQRHANGLRSPDRARYGDHLPWVPCGHTPRELQEAYGVRDAIRGGNDGRGTAIAILGIGTTATVQQDVDAHARRHGLPPVDLQIVESPVPAAQPPPPELLASSAYEQALDIEAAHTTAPRARIVYEQMASGTRFDLLGAVNDIVVNDRARIVSISFSERGESQPRPVLEASEQVFMFAAARGVGIYVVTGDRGDGRHDPALNTPAANWPAVSAWVTAVGGTSLGIGPSAKRGFEVPWATFARTLGDAGWSSPRFRFGAGGGPSRRVPQPPYQRPVVPPSIANRYAGTVIPITIAPGRVIPDISAVADPHTGFLVGQTLVHPDGSTRYAEHRSGGTSLAAPLIAGLVALADQRAGSARGFVNPVLYAARRSAFHDVLAAPDSHPAMRHDPGSAPTFNTTGNTESLCAAAGYDDASGLGTPAGAAFLAALAEPAPVPREAPDRGCTTSP
ncbi:MAG TPA: S53 family peptidase [Solirubrobacteraceae bacterium]|nr:S53 family peptidase [Solirubrobacteraceae bacterium]